MPQQDGMRVEASKACFKCEGIHIRMSVSCVIADTCSCTATLCNVGWSYIVYMYSSMVD